MKSTPHVIPYQGSKRKLAHKILAHTSKLSIDTVFEPFAGSGAVSIAAAYTNLANQYIISDKYPVITSLLDSIIKEPKQTSAQYRALWEAQLGDPYSFYFSLRDEFNKDQDPIKFLYLIARCVKNAIRFNSMGEFNQSPDKRRLGTKPETMEKNIFQVSNLLNGCSTLGSGDFSEFTALATSKDFVYLDPPWQGTSTKKNSRYAHLLDLSSLIDELDNLNIRNVPYILSFDGTCGKKSYGSTLPRALKLIKIELSAGRSSQATLLGRTDKTIESLYLSPALIKYTTIAA